MSFLYPPFAKSSCAFWKHRRRILIFFPALPVNTGGAGKQDNTQDSRYQTIIEHKISRTHNPSLWKHTMASFVTHIRLSIEILCNFAMKASMQLSLGSISTTFIHPTL